MKCRKESAALNFEIHFPRLFLVCVFKFDPLKEVFFNLTLHRILCLAAPSTAVLSRSEPAPAGPSRDSCGDQDSDKRNAL